ncbi:MAG: DUF502 domain-containing protein [Fibrobacter sp.]|nr:DUF502 domain-containing protein [Fibrobacter sp.]
MATFLVKKFFKQIRTNIITGTLLIIPLFVTVIIMVKLFQWVDSALPGILGADWAPGIGILITLLIAYFGGLTAKNYFGKKFIDVGNAIISNIPILNKIYLSIQQIVDAVSRSKKTLFERAVLVEYPKENSYCIGFVTSTKNPDISKKAGKNLVAVFVPTTPNPTSGFLLYYPESEVIDLNIQVETAIKLIISGGILNAENPGKGKQTTASFKDGNWMKIFSRDPVKASTTDPRD